MKKILLILFSIIFILGCQNKNIKNETVELTNEEKILLMINQCIDDYNSNLIKDREVEWNTTIKPLPINVKNIKNITSLKELKEINPQNKITSAVYIGTYDIGDYNMVFEIFNYGNNFWLNGEVNFEVKLETIKIDNPQFSEIKKTLDNLLEYNIETFAYLYGVGIQLGKESETDKGFYMVENNGNYIFNSISDIKQKVENIFTTEFLEKYYNIAFNSEDPIFKEIDGKLYCYETDTTIAESLPYDTSRIIATKEENNNLLIDLVITFDQDVSNELQRIILVKTENGYRLNNTY